MHQCSWLVTIAMKAEAKHRGYAEIARIRQGADARQIEHLRPMRQNRMGRLQHLRKRGALLSPQLFQTTSSVTTEDKNWSACRCKADVLY